MQTKDKLLSPKEASHFLEIGDSTLRKWCIALEEQKYNFMRTEQKKRLFSEKDLFVLSNFKTLVKDKNLSINAAAEIMSNKYSEDMVFVNSTEKSRIEEQSVKSEQNTSEITRQLEHMQTEMEQLKELNRTLLVKLDEQYEYIKERDQRVLEALQESQENKQLLLEIKEEQQKQEKKGWRSWFGK